MYKYPEKIRQIVSLHKIEDFELSQNLHLLKEKIHQFRIVKKGRVSYIQKEILNLQKKNPINVYREAIDLENNLTEDLKKCVIACKARLKELNLNLDVDNLIKEFLEKKLGSCLISILKVSRTDENSLVPISSVITLKCFIAGAKSLERERDAIIAGINDLNISNKCTNSSIECYTFKNFNSIMTKEGQQFAYNNFIKNEANIVVFVLNDVLGGITKEEFDVAYETLMLNDYRQPAIFVFSNKENEGIAENKDIADLRIKINDIKHYWIDYSSLEVLKLKIQLELDNWIKKELKLTSGHK